MKTIQKIGILSLLGVVGLFQANAAFAQAETTLGAQVCMPMNLPLASTLQWRSEGLFNNNTVTQWVVCPLAFLSEADSVDVTTRVRNRSGQTATVQCLTKVTSEVGNTLKSVSNTRDLTPDMASSMTESDLRLDRGNSISVSCNLPPEFQVISFSVESKDN